MMELGSPDEDDCEVPVVVAVRVKPGQGGPVGVQVNSLTGELFLSGNKFSFDYTFGPNCTQEEVYQSSLEPLLITFLDGYNVSVVTYGAEGTGKTHTLVGPDMGPALGEEQFGLIPRIVRSLFRVLDEVGGIQTSVEISYVEVFNEEVRDLLSDNLSGVFIDYDQQGNPRLAGLNMVQCGSIREVLACLETGQALHRTGGLSILSTSQPASHTLFSIKLTQMSQSRDGTQLLRQSTLQFCDLAPSDRMTGPTGATNLGLLALGNVVSALGDPRRNVSYVPYQDSLLTSLLSPALGGNCFTLLVCTVSSLQADSEENFNTLQLAYRAANIKNSPQPSIVRQEAPPSLPQMQNDNQSLQLQLSPQSQPHVQLHSQIHKQSHSQLHNHSYSQPQNQPHNQPQNQPYSQLHNHPQNQSQGQSYNQPQNQPYSQPHNKPQNQPYNQPHNQPYNQFHSQSHNQLHSPPYIHHRALSQPHNQRQPHIFSQPQSRFQLRRDSNNSIASQLPSFQSPNPPQNFSQQGAPFPQNRHTPSHQTPPSYQHNPALYHQPTPPYPTNVPIFPSDPSSQVPINPAYRPDPLGQPGSPTQYSSPPRYPGYPPQPSYYPTHHPIQPPHYSMLSPPPQPRPVHMNMTGATLGAIPPMSPTQTPFTAQTTPTSLSPSKMQLYHPSPSNILPPALPTALPNTLHSTLPEDSITDFHSISLPNLAASPLVGNQGHLLMDRNTGDHTNLTGPVPASHNMHNTSGREEIFALQFAASQYKSLVTNAESLLQNISRNEETRPCEKNAIESWLCKKEESEHVIQKSSREGDKNPLAKILEESEDETEAGDSSVKSTDTKTETSEDYTDVGESIEEFDSECSDVSAEDLEAKLEVIEIQFRTQTDALVNDAEVEFWTALGMNDLGEIKTDPTDICETKLFTEATAETKTASGDNDNTLIVDLDTRIAEHSSCQTKTDSGLVNESDLDLERLHQQLSQLKSVIQSKEAYIRDLQKEGRMASLAKRRLEAVNLETMVREGSKEEEIEVKERMMSYKGKVAGLEEKEEIVEMKPPVDRRVVELQEQLQVLLEQHQRLQERLSEEQERKRTLQETVKRDQTVIVELEVKLKEQEEKLQESLSVSRDLQERKERMKQEEDRLGQLGAATERLRASLQERERQLAVREGQEMEFVETSFIESGFNMKNQHLESKKRAEIQDLRVIRDQLVSERQELDDKLHDQKSLTSQEERRMIELDESVEAIDGAIEYKNDVICGKNVEYDSTYRGDDVLMQRLVKLEVAETRAMLHRYFVKVLDLRMEGKWMEDNFKEVEEQYADLGKCTRDLHHSLQRSKLDCERRLLAQQREYQVKINVLVQQLAQEGGGERGAEQAKRVRALEKEVTHYRRLCREMRREEDGPRHHHEQEVPTFPPEETSRPPSVQSVQSLIQPTHIEQFQRRLARLQRKMGDSGRPTVTREHRKLIIENPVSASSSVEKSREKLGRKKK